jgi:hypothetical protein
VGLLHSIPMFGMLGFEYTLGQEVGCARTTLDYQDVADIECCAPMLGGDTHTGSSSSAIVVRFVHTGVPKGAEFCALAFSRWPVAWSFITMVKSTTRGTTQLHK